MQSKPTADQKLLCEVPSLLSSARAQGRQWRVYDGGIIPSVKKSIDIPNNLWSMNCAWISIFKNSPEQYMQYKGSTKVIHGNGKWGWKIPNPKTITGELWYMYLISVKLSLLTKYRLRTTTICELVHEEVWFKTLPLPAIFVGQKNVMSK